MGDQRRNLLDTTVDTFGWQLAVFDGHPTLVMSTRRGAISVRTTFAHRPATSHEPVASVLDWVERACDHSFGFASPDGGSSDG